MAENDNTGILIIGGVVVYLVASGKLAGLLGGAVNNPNIPNGRPPPPRKVSDVGVDDQIARGVGAAGCVGAGIATGMPALGFVAAPACGYIGEKIWDGAKWTGGKVATVAAGVWHNTLGNLGGPSLTPEQRAATARISKPVGFR